MKFKPNFYWYLRKHPGYIAGMVAPLIGLFVTNGLARGICIGFITGAIASIIFGYPSWKRNNLTQYDKDGNDITTNHK